MAKKACKGMIVFDIDTCEKCEKKQKCEKFQTVKYFTNLSKEKETEKCL